MMKLLEKLKNRKSNNKGFSLVELIIVIAIMAILIGIVGTQVVPYIEKSKESKDLQLVNSYSTAAVSAYSQEAGKLTSTGSITVDVYAASAEGDAAILQAKIKELVGYDALPTIKGKMGSKKGKNITGITIVIDPTSHTVTTTADGTGLDPVKADL